MQLIKAVTIYFKCCYAINKCLVLCDDIAAHPQLSLLGFPAMGPEAQAFPSCIFKSFLLGRERREAWKAVPELSLPDEIIDFVSAVWF